MVRLGLVGFTVAVAVQHENPGPVRRAKRDIHTSVIDTDGTIKGYSASDELSRDMGQIMIDSSGEVVGSGPALLESAGVSKVKHDQHLVKHLATLEGFANGDKELPDSIKAFIESIKNHASDIRQKLVDEHASQVFDLDATFAAISTCDDDLTTNLVPIDGDGEESAKSHVSRAKSALCDCRKGQAMTNADDQGCAEELACRDTVAQSALESKTKFIAEQTGTAAGMCANTDAWQTMAGANDGDKALTWFAQERTSWNTHWTDKKTQLQNLIDAYNTAQTTRDALRLGTTPYENKGCELLATTKAAKDTECLQIQEHATMNQCYYVSQKQSKCHAYAECRTDTEAAWNTAKQRETVNSQDRKDAWVSAAKVKCLAESFVENAGGKLEVTAGSSCSAITCDTACIAALDLTVSLARVPGAKLPCAPPPSACSAGGWEPSCDATETGNWGSYSPKYFIGTRNAPVCDGTVPVPMDLANGQVMDTCQACSGANNGQAITTPHVYPVSTSSSTSSRVNLDPVSTSTNMDQAPTTAP